MKASKLLCVGAMLTAFLGAEAIGAREPELSADQAKVLEQVRASALAYRDSLPDLTCRRITERETLSVPGQPWQVFSTGSRIGRIRITTAGNGVDLIEERLTFSGRRERDEILTVNGRKTDGVNQAQIQSMMRAGELGSAFEEIFMPQSQTEFTWSRMGKVRRRLVYVFGFHVPVEHGVPVMLAFPNQQIRVSYGGQISVDAENLNVLEIRSTLDLPPGSGLQKGESSVEYAPVSIAGKDYNLPLHSEVQMRDKDYSYINKIDFKNYQKFVVQSTIHYNAGSQR